MLSWLAAPVSSFLKSQPPQPAPAQGVPELLAALAEIRARKAELEQKEKEIVASTRTRLAEQQQALEELKRKVNDHGIMVDADSPTPAPTQPALPSS